MNTGRVKSDQETIVWAIEVTDDLTVISGYYSLSHLLRI